MAVWSVTSKKEITENHRIDSEYFRPFYLEAEEKVLAIENKRLGQIGQFLIGPFGSAFHVSNYDPTSPYRYIRGKDVKPFTLLDEDSVYMPEKDFIRLEKYAVMSDDLLISVVGTLGNVAIVPSEVKGIFSCKSTIFRNSKMDPYYLLAYFNSKYGRDCLLRRQRGAVQTGLNKDDLKTVPVPIFDEEFEIGELVRQALSKSNMSKQLYAEAQQLLEEELGLNALVLEKPKSYESSFSKVVSSSRGDADFHNPLLKMYYIELEKNNALVKVTKFAKVMKFSNPDYSANEGIPIITQKHLGNICPVEYDEDIKSTVSWYKKNPEAILKENDLLFYSVGAYLGKTNIWFNRDMAVPASFITLLRAYTKEDAAYLMLLFNSKFGILQSKVFQSGTSQQYIYPKDIKKFLVPDIKLETKIKLYNMLFDSFNARKESEQLIEQAKRRVEELIQGGTES